MSAGSAEMLAVSHLKRIGLFLGLGSQNERLLETVSDSSGGALETEETVGELAVEVTSHTALESLHLIRRPPPSVASSEVL